MRKLLFTGLMLFLFNACGRGPASPPPAAPISPTPGIATPGGSPTPSPPRTPTAAPALPIPETTPSTSPLTFQPRVEVVAAGLEVPWALAFAPDGRIFVTERPGRIRVIENGQLRPEPVAVLPVAATGEGGLMGLALDPNFAQNGQLYVMYTYRSGGALRNRISRLTLRGNTAGEEMVLVDNIPGANIHNGGRLAFGPDGKLYATTGDAAQRNLAQQLDSLAGKILRLNPDGTIPPDNPFPGSYVYSYGHRNPQGLAWHPTTGQLYSTEHGPTGEMGLCCRDELNLIRPGGNYGWPRVTGIAGDPRFIDPILYSGEESTWAPAGMAFVTGDRLVPWKDHLFFATLRGQHLHHVVLGPDGTSVVFHEELFRGEFGRIRDVVMGPDGALYFTTSNRDGRGQPRSGDDRILRIVPGP
ncbi:sorbosone dehydrogenase family protein [Thermoflexus sp.]|uniref:PQQ-dependent sugar dehydrogenase n=1 Tax=Thermoflexus sp. TaxID=1969742 RepID=UPI0025F5850F|nr:PQQ-dependent sugar dehydrogenase [Thermoflexus sp.]MDW8179921.1 PQQ-dependent sugar dehydrogenase [Anaerolineae bacterium]MCS6964034.1 PQQ-dependent sugar dehydrogenase [Thermoflexus sp.]MCS7350470.1 PQQ-dependent sugar dehydrogenase [Thermoflexus sp.]MCX7689339.1 PQQ-dependent sugar dehydrogenase [Thermoflexus sp.]MDW8183872.1 PQQ-dependent sugar dehydrogenase [Anaerolineae bacterium]